MLQQSYADTYQPHRPTVENTLAEAEYFTTKAEQDGIEVELRLCLARRAESLLASIDTVQSGASYHDASAGMTRPVDYNEIRTRRDHLIARVVKVIGMLSSTSAGAAEVLRFPSAPPPHTNHDLAA